MALIQLRPYEESFNAIIFKKLKKLDALLLCEGKTEVEVIKTIVKRLNIAVSRNVGVTDCSGINALYDITNIAILLLRVARKIEKLGVLMDAEEMDIDRRVGSVLQSLKSSGVSVGKVEELCSQTRKVTLPDLERTLYIAVSGDFSYNFKTHMLEDHAITLLMLEGKLNEESLKQIAVASEIVDRRELIKHIDSSMLENVAKAFNHIVCLLNGMI